MSWVGWDHFFIELRPGFDSYGETALPMPVSLNGSIFTVPVGKLAETCRSPPEAAFAQFLEPGVGDSVLFLDVFDSGGD